MTEYTYGPWVPHTGDECPVEKGTLVQIWCDGDSNERAVGSLIMVECRFIWRSSLYDYRPIRFYRVCTPVEELWQTVTGCNYDCDDRLYVISGVTPHPSDTLRISWPYTITNGKRVPDFTRQPKWEPLK